MFLTQLTLACALAFVVEDPQSVRLPSAWSVGTAYHVEFTKSREEIEEGRPTKRNSSRTPIDVEVVAKRDDGYTVRWTFGRPVLAADIPIDNALVERISTLVEGLKLDMLTDKTGSITKLEDPSVMDTHFERASKLLFDEIEAQKSLSSTDLASLKKTLSALKGPNFQASYLSFPRLFYMPAGSELTVGEKREYEDHLPNPFGGDPLPSKAYLVLTKLNASANEAVVDWRQTIDPAKAGPILEASIRTLAKRTGQEIPQEAALSFDAIEDASTYVYDLTTGIPKSVVSSRTTVMAGRRRIDTQEFVVSSRPPK